MSDKVFKVGDRVVMHGKRFVTMRPPVMEPRIPTPGVVIAAEECAKKLLRERGVDMDEKVPNDLVCVLLDKPDPETQYRYFIVHPIILTLVGEGTMRIDEWFDPVNLQHLVAYKALEDNGMWPKGFIPEGMEFPPAWHISLMAKLADKWIEYKVTAVSQKTNTAKSKEE